MRLFLVPGLLLLLVALFVRSYTVPPAPDRRGGTTVFLTAPNRPFFGSPRGDCLGTPADEPVIACLVGSMARARNDVYTLVQLPFCAQCYAVSQRLAAYGRDEATVQAHLVQISRFGW